MAWGYTPLNLQNQPGISPNWAAPIMDTLDQNQKLNRERATLAARKNLPVGADGRIDYTNAAEYLLQRGDFEGATKLAEAGRPALEAQATKNFASAILGEVATGGTRAAPGSSASAPLDLMASAGTRYGINPETMTMIGGRESGGNPNAQNPRSSAGGLGQFTDATWSQYGNGADKMDPQANADATARLARDNIAAFRREFGREPTPQETYLYHQQGVAGAPALLRNPQMNAIDALTPAYRGNRQLAERAVIDNGGTPNMTAGEFAQRVMQGGGAQRQGGFDGAPVRMSPRVQQLLVASLDPNLPKNAQSVVSMLLKQEMDKTDYPPSVKEWLFAKSQGDPRGFSQWKMENSRAGAANIQIDNKGEGEFAKAAGKGQAESFQKMFDEGIEAGEQLGLIGELRALGGRIDTGAAAVVKQYLGAIGIKSDGIGDVEAMNALLNRLTPGQRVPGSGATSDFEMRMFKGSLPGLMNTPQGNALILDTMEALANHKQAVADIAARALNREITQTEAYREIRALPDPMARYREYRKTQGQGQPAGQSPQGAPQQSGPVPRVNTPAEMNALPSGSLFIAPDGTTRRKP